MNTLKKRNNKQTPCHQCPLRELDHFRDFTPEELEFVSHFKMGELAVDAGATILSEGANSAHLFTVLSGWGFRYKMLDDGRRQILNYMMPGDLIGLQGALMQEMQHSVEALSPVTLCVFERAKLNQLFSNHPGLGYDMTWIAAQEERILDENLLSLGRRSALERAAYLLAFLFRRAEATSLFEGQRVSLPITQQHVADTLGLSIVHTNRTLRKLADRKLIRWAERGCDILDDEGLAQIAGWSSAQEVARPFV